MLSGTVNRLLTGGYLMMEGFQVNFNFFLDNENILLAFFITGGKRRKRWLKLPPLKTREH